jgi:hypothetical protein
MQRQHVFIIGAPRSGTSWLQTMLGSHPAVATTVELTLFDRYFPPILKTWSEERALHENNVFSLGLGFLWDSSELDDFLKFFADAVYGRVADRKSGATHVIDKRPPYAFHVETIARILPGARFLNIVRDGRDVVVSMMKMWRKMGWFSGTARGSAREWLALVEGARSAERAGLPYLEIRYEDLLNKGESTLLKICDFLDLDWSETQIGHCLKQHGFKAMRKRLQGADDRVKANPVHFGTGKAGGWSDQLSARQCCAIEQEAGDLLRELAYVDTRDWWIRRPWHHASLPVLCKIPAPSEVTPLMASAAARWLHPDRVERLRNTWLSRQLLSQRTHPQTGAKMNGEKE